MKRTKLNLRCRECGCTTVVHTKEPIMCKACKNTEWYCFNCHEYFEPEEICGRCRWFICPKCDSCGCDYMKLRTKTPRRVIKGKTVSQTIRVSLDGEPPFEPLF